MRDKFKNIEYHYIKYDVRGEGERERERKKERERLFYKAIFAESVKSHVHFSNQCGPAC